MPDNNPKLIKRAIHKLGLSGGYTDVLTDEELQAIITLLITGLGDKGGIKLAALGEPEIYLN